MSDRIETELNFIDVDLDQWRRDIDTFNAVTTSALEAIISELSTVCSGGQVRSDANRSSVQAPVKRTKFSQSAKSDSAPARPVASIKSTDKSSSPANSESRMASLKEKLASRIKKP